MTTPKRIATRKAGNTPSDRLARKTSADADTVAPSASDMMLPVMVMNVMPTATQPMKEIALSSELMLSGEVKPGVLSANNAIAPPATMRTASTSWRARTLPTQAKSRAQRNVAHAAATGWVMSASTRCTSASPRR